MSLIDGMTESAQLIEPKFIHLRTHTAYSLAEGAIKMKALVKLADAHNMPALAVTDTNNMFGAMDFSYSASGAGIQPIIGAQISFATSDDQVKKASDHHGTKRLPEMVLLVTSEEGFVNLSRILSRGYLNKDATDPFAVRMDLLRECNEGLICLTGGYTGPVDKLIANGHPKDARSLLEELQGIFGDRLYIEIMRHKGRTSETVEEAMIDMAYDLNIPLVATNNNFFAKPDMFSAHSALLCIAEGTYISDDNRRQETPDHYFKSPDDMCELFADLPEALESTVTIAKRCRFHLTKRKPELPAYHTEGGRSEDEELSAQSAKGLDWRLEKYVYTPDMDEARKQELRKQYFERMEYELGIIKSMGFPGYFLIVADFIQWAKDHDIPVGPGRGSGAGSVVAWSLKITDLDPIHYGLLFERFLNPERVSMPDFDVDFCQSRREEVIHYVQEKYGKDHVAQIITFGKLQAKAVVRDVGRVLQMPYMAVDKISKLIPANPANPVSLEEALDIEPQLREMMAADETTNRLIEIALQLEGLYRHASTHAAGVVIGNKPLEEICPLYQDPKSDMPATQFNMKFVEDISLIKFDFLGLKTLTVLKTALDNIHETEGRDDIDLLALPMQDDKTFNLMRGGQTVGVFQFESSGMQDIMRKAKPNRIEDLIALNSLYRPGPMDNIPTYIAVKDGEQEPDYMHPSLQGILEETYGIMVYQEQVMQLAQILAGYTLGGADLLRRAMGKKIKEAMDVERVKFIKGSKEVSDVEEEKSSAIFDQVAKFAGYGFNKSHAAAYSLIAYQTGYLKANYPHEFMAATMTLDMGNTDKINFFSQDLRNWKIELLTPDINRSRVTFAVERMKDAETGEEHKAIRYALGAIKGVGAAAMASVVDEREQNGDFKDLNDFMNRVDLKSFSRKQLEVLAMAGAFDCFGMPRARIVTNADSIMRQAQNWAEEKNSGQVNLFGGGGDDNSDFQTLIIEETNEWPEMDRLDNEQKAIGFYLSAHPLDSQFELLKKNKFMNFVDLKDKQMFGSMNRNGSNRAQLAGVVVKRQEKQSDRGRYAFVTLSDRSGLYDVTVYSEPLALYRDILTDGNLVAVTVEVMYRDDEPRMILRSAQMLDQILETKVQEIIIKAESPEALDGIERILCDKNKHGRVKVFLEITLADMAKTVRIEMDGGWSIPLDDQAYLKTLPGVQVMVS